MAGLVGADVDQLRALSRRFAGAADRLRGVVSEVSGRVSSARWAGPDSERFGAQWQGESVSRLRSAADALEAAASALQRNADEQDRASSAADGGIGGAFGPGPPRPAWGWPGDVGATPWFLRPGGGLPDPGTTPTLPKGTNGALRDGNNGAGPRWSFPNPFDDYRDFVGKTPIWPINDGTATGIIPIGEATTYVGGAASPWAGVVGEFDAADFRPATVANDVPFINAHPAEAFDAARDAVLDYIPKLISNFSFSPFGK